MTIDRSLLDKIRSRGEEVLTQVSSELMANPRFVKAIEGAVKGREKLEEAATAALKQMNVPTRTELKRATSRIEALERELAEVRAKLRARPAGAARPAAAAPKAAPRGRKKMGGIPGAAE